MIHGITTFTKLRHENQSVASGYLSPKDCINTRVGLRMLVLHSEAGSEWILHRTRYKGDGAHRALKRLL